MIVVCPFVLLLWALCCLSSDLRTLITPLVSSNSSDIITDDKILDDGHVTGGTEIADPSGALRVIPGF